MKRLLQIVFLGVMLLTIGTAMAQDTEVFTDQKIVDWFTLKAASVANWNWTLTPDDPNRFTLTMKTPMETEIPEKNILVLFTKNSSSYDVALDRILTVFMSKKIPVTLTAVNFLRDNDLGKAVLAYADQEQFDLIFTAGSDATDWVYSNYNGGAIPVVSVTSKDPVLLDYLPDYETGSGTNMAFTSLNVRIDLQMIYLQALIPDLKNIAVLYAETNTSAKETQVEPLRDIAKDYSINIVDVMLADKDLKAEFTNISSDGYRNGAREQLQALIPAAIAEIDRTDPQHGSSIFWITGTTEVFQEIETINQVSGNVPILSAVPDVVREGDNSAILSIGVSFESNAHIAALYASDILLGEAIAGDLPVGLVSPPDIAINFMKAREIGLQVPFSFFESASIVYDYDGHLVRKDGQVVAAPQDIGG